MRTRLLSINSLLAMALVVSSANYLVGQPVESGLEVLVKSNFEIIKGKRTGLITNPTGVDQYLRSNIDILFKANGVKLVALFSPEHGVRGDFAAGEQVGTAFDPVTKLAGAQFIWKNQETDSGNA